MMTGRFRAASGHARIGRDEDEGGSTMKALLCDHYGPAGELAIPDLLDPIPGPGEVVIAVHAAPLNFFYLLYTPRCV